MEHFSSAKILLSDFIQLFRGKQYFAEIGEFHVPCYNFVVILLFEYRMRRCFSYGFGIDY